MADKIVKAFEALRSHYLHESKEQPTASDVSDSPGPSNKKKEVSLTSRERIAHCNLIADFLPMHTVKEMNEFPRLLALAMELLLVCCDDNEADVRLVAGECINKTIKAFLDSNIGRIQVEFYKEIKKNGPSRSLRSALQRFAETCHLIRANKCRPYVQNLLPCIVKIVKRIDDSIQETLGIFMLKVCPVLGDFMIDADVKILLKAFLSNLRSSSAVTRRTAAATINIVCKSSNKPLHFYSWTISMLLGMITPLTDDLPAHTILGVLLAFRNMVPHLADVNKKYSTMKGSFGTKPFSPNHDKDRIIEKKQFLQIYEVTMFCTKHKDHNVVTASLENLLQLLLCEAEPIQKILLSPSGIAPTITGQLATLSDIKLHQDSPVPSEAGDTTSDLQSMSSLSISSDLLNDKDKSETSSLNEAALGEVGQSMESALYADIPNIPLIKVNQDVDTSSVDTGVDMTDDIDVGLSLPRTYTDDDGLSLPRTYTQGSMVNIESPGFQREHLSSVISDIPNDSASQTSMEDIYRIDSISSYDARAAIERYFNFDAVTCDGVPILHCVRLMCSFLLNGVPGEVLSDRMTRVSVKSLALNCIAAALKLFPESLCATVLPDFLLESKSIKNCQLVRDVLLLHTHEDPQIKGNVALIIGNLFIAAVVESSGDLDKWNESKCNYYGTEALKLPHFINILMNMLQDESAVCIKHSCVAIKYCLPSLARSKYNLQALDFAWALLNLADCSYWLVKVEILEVFLQIDYRLMSLLQTHWLSMRQCSKLSFKHMDLQEQVVKVLMTLLGDEDSRVRLASAQACVKIVPNLNCCCLRNESQVSISEVIGYKKNNYNSMIKLNLSYLLRRIISILTTAVTKYLMHGCTQVCYLLSNEYPVVEYAHSWEIFPGFKSKKLDKVNKDRSLTVLRPARKLAFEDELHNSSSGLLNITFDLISSAWMTLDLQAHQEALKLCVHLLCGSSHEYIMKKQNTETTVESAVTGIDSLWIVLKDPQLISFAQKLFVHLLKLLCITHHVVEMINPLAVTTKFQIGFANQGKDKTPIPGTATVATPPTSATSTPTAVTQTTNSPRKFNLPKAMQRKTDSTPVDQIKVAAAAATPTNESKQSGTPTNVPTNEKTDRIGVFYNIPHYLKLYEVLKGAFKNYQVSSVASNMEKFNAFVRGLLESFSLFLEIATFNELGSHADEFLDYLKSTAKVEEEMSFLAVQQLLKGLFGTNFASQPDTYKMASSISQLVKDRGDPTYSYDNIDNHATCNKVTNELFTNSIYSSFFVKSYENLLESLKDVPQVENTTDKSSRASSLLNRFKRSVIPNRPNMKVSKERISSIQSYIRLFEPLVIHALKAYTTTSSTQIQCQSIHLLDQLIRLRVNYSLLDSDQVFIGFVLKQFEFIEKGQVRSPEQFIPTVFQFLVLLSYECYQPKFTQAKAIIGMPRIMKLCDDIMACGQPALKYALPALKPIVHDLFATASQARPDSGKDLDTQREVVISMLLRVIQYPQVLDMLTKVLNGCKSDDEKWKKLSREIVDTLLPCLSKLQINISTVRDLENLYSLLDALAPIALRPADIILKALFDVHLPNCVTTMIKTLSLVMSLIRILLVQNSEDIIISRIKELDTSFVRSCFCIFNSKQDFELKTSKTEQASTYYFASYLLYILQSAVEVIGQSYNSIIVNKDSMNILIEMVEKLLRFFVYISKSGRFKLLSAQISSLLSSVITGNGAEEKKTFMQNLSNHLSPIKYNKVQCFLTWLYMLESLHITEYSFWKQFWLFETDNKDVSSNFDWCNKCIRNGAFVLYCNIIFNKLREQKSVDVALVISILKENFMLMLRCIEEKPVNDCLSQMLRIPELSCLFLQMLSLNLLPDIKNIKPILLQKIYNHLESIDLGQSSVMVSFLVELLPFIKICGIARKFETLICRRMEYLQSLHNKENAVPFESLMAFSKKKHYNKRYPRLSALIQRQRKQSISVDQILSTHPLEMLPINLKEYNANKDWMYRFVENLCFSSSLKNKVKITQSTVHLLRALNIQDIHAIMNNEKFDIDLLKTCVDACSGFDKTKSHSKHNKLELFNVYDTGGSTEFESKEKLFTLSRTLLLQHIQSFIPKFISHISIEDIDYNILNQSELRSLQNDEDRFNEYMLLLRCLMKLLSPCCFYNQPWEMTGEDAEKIFQFLWILPELCSNKNVQRNDELLLIEDCFQALSLSLHCREFGWLYTKQSYALYVKKMIDIVYQLVINIALPLGSYFDGLKVIEDLHTNIDDMSTTRQVDDSLKRSCKQVSDLIDAVRSCLSKSNKEKSSIPQFLSTPLMQVIVGLARIPLVNSYARIPPIVWKFGWEPTPEGIHGTELPPLPVEILKEKDVLTEFVFRVNLIGWVSRMQFEETWAALLGVLSAPPALMEDASVEEEVELAQSSCVAVHCITSLLLDTTLSPVPGNPAVSLYSIIHRQKDYPFLGSKAGKKLAAIRSKIESVYLSHATHSNESFLQRFVHPVIPSLLSAKQRKQQLHGCMMEGKLFVSNLELPLVPDSFKLGQISASALRTRLVTSDVQEDTDSDDSDSLIIKVKDKTPPPIPQAMDSTFFRKLDELDIRSCLQFLLELFEQWLSPYVTPKTPLLVKLEAIKSLCVLSDLLLELNHYEWVLGILLEFSQSHPIEDDVLAEYLVPTLCKALAVLKLEGTVAERICKQVEQYLKSPHVPLQISCLVGSLYILESYVSSTNIILAPILTEFITKKMSSPIDSSNVISVRLSLVLWSTSFFLIENCSSEIQDAHFPTTVLEIAIEELCKKENSYPTLVIDVLFRGLERLAVSFSLTRAECDRLAKIASNCVSSGSSNRNFAALGLLCTCMYTGKDAEQASGLSTMDLINDAPITDSRLVLMERINVLLTRIRCSQLSEAVLLATILPRILLDFLPIQEVMNKLISEFLSSQQPRPELIAKIFNNVADILYKEGEEATVRDWVLLCIASFVQRTPLSMAVWSLTCFFISASANPWLKSLFPFIVERKGKLEDDDRQIFIMAALDFFTNQNLDHIQQDQFIQTFRAKIDNSSSPYEKLVACCQTKTVVR